MTTTLLIISHTPTANALIQAAQAVLPDDLDNVIAYDIHLNDTLEKATQISSALPQDDLLILTDLLGSSPYNIAKQIQQERPQQQNCELVTGLNLAMLLKVINYQQLGANELAKKAVSGGKKSIILDSAVR